jgi:hypothetical protein
MHRRVHNAQVPAAVFSVLQGPRGPSRSRTQPAKFALKMSGRGQRYAPAIVGLTLLAALCAAAPAFAEFGLQRVAVSARTQVGTPSVQAGAHPYSLTTTLLFNIPPENQHNGNAKNVSVELPPGLVGDPTATPRCAYPAFLLRKCSNESAIGNATTYDAGPADAENEFSALSSPVYNLVPPRGVAAEFGFLVGSQSPVLLASIVRTGADYGVTVNARDINEAIAVAASKVTLWGVPADPSHNSWRGSCLRSAVGGEFRLEQTGQGLGASEFELEGPMYKQGEESESGGMPESSGECPSGAPELPLLTNPVACGRPLAGSVSADSWEEQGKFHTAKVEMPDMVGCGSSAFSTKLAVTPELTAGSTPTGLDFEAQQPQEGLESPGGLAESDLKEYSVPLPEGLQLNASSVNDLGTCSLAQIGYTGTAELDPSTEPGVLTPQFTPGAPSCPNASKIGNVRIKSPLLEGELEGAVYVAAPQNFKAGPLENPFGSLTAAYGVAEEPQTGVMVKLPANILRNPETGQLTFTLKDSPQLPYTVAKIELFGGERAALATTARCGTYTTEGTFTPWSGTLPFLSLSSFQITSGPGGSACPTGALPFSPSLQTGTSSINAGAFSPLSTVINRADGQQAIHNVTINYPPGVSAVLTGVPECPEAQANAGTCGPESLIGEDTASVGLGQDPYTVTGGKAYMTGPYDGAPFGLSIVTPTKAGPFILDEGAPVVTRAKIEINPTTAAVSVTSGEIPKILDGIPLQVKQIDVNINRPNFAINPTSCEHMNVSGSVGGWEGTSFPVSDPFQVANCANLKFQPEVAVSTGAHSSKKDGANLDIKVSYPNGALGTQAWFKQAKLVIPKQLPAELKTLQQACLAATFEANLASCPVHSKIGEAVVHTQLLPEPLKGPIYFVSYGSAKFPDAVILLSGDNVNVRLTSETFIKSDVTSVTLPEIPGVPIESAEFNLPTGEYSEFGTNLGSGKYDFCGQKLTVPTEFKAQNGLEIHQETAVTVTGCTPAITVVSHSVKGHTATIVVNVPSAGKLTATGKGVSKGTGKATKAADVTVKVALTKAESAALSKHKGRKLKAAIKLTFSPTKGAELKTTTTVVIG